MKGLVDLDGFEPSTSSMPFKKYQHLPTVRPKTKDLTDGGLDASGRHGATFQRLDSARTPYPKQPLTTN